MKSHEKMSQRPKSMKYHKEHLIKVLPLVTNRIRCYIGHCEYTQSPVFFNTTSLPSSHHNITFNSKPPTEPSNHTIAWVHVTSSHILHYTYSLTFRHIGNFRDVPLIEVSVEGVSRKKHCCKKRRLITFTVNEQEKKAEEASSNTVTAQRRQHILQITYINPPTQSPE
jgi:hypothetical protein